MHASRFNFPLQERCINAGTLTVNYEKVGVDYRLKHNDLLANVVHRYVCRNRIAFTSLHELFISPSYTQFINI